MRAVNSSEVLERDRVVVVPGEEDGASIVSFLEGRYPSWRIVSCPSLLSGIAQVVRDRPTAVMIRAEGSASRLQRAVAGFRAAAGRGARIVLCCTPGEEPAAREVIAAGADEYVVLPLEGTETDRVLGYARGEMLREPPPAPPASTRELEALSEALKRIEGRPSELIEAIGRVVQVALSARGVTVVVEGAVATAGDVVTKPVLSTAIRGGEGVLGQILVGECGGRAYTPADVEKLTHYAGIAGQLVESARRQRAWRELAVTDECSGLPNRRFLRERLESVLKEAGRRRLPVTLLLFDIDDFKTYNDDFGHDAGDEILRTIGGLFRKHCREQDIVARYGGDEFAVVFWDPEGSRMAGSAPPQQALDVLDRFRESLQAAEFPRLAAAKTEVTISGGLATYPWDAATVEALVSRADEALLAAKRAGKNRVFVIGE